MKKHWFLFCFILVFSSVFGQEKFKLYHPEADAQKELQQAIALAQKENKHILLEIGGNWCGWCKLFHELTTSDETIKNYLSEHFIVLPINYSKENTNAEILEQLDFPQRFGFPVFVILDEKGQRLHTQNSGYLEEGQGHSPKKVLEFLKHWSPQALNPENYNR